MFGQVVGRCDRILQMLNAVVIIYIIFSLHNFAPAHENLEFMPDIKLVNR